MKPSLTVLLLCWNHRAYLEQCIAGLTAQSDREFEIIFLDNFSSDGSFEEARRLFDRHELRVTMMRNEANQRIAPNLNRLLAAATTDLVSALSTDDWFLPRYVEAMRGAAQAEPDILWYFGGRFEFYQATGRTSEPLIDFRDGEVTVDFTGVSWPINMVGCCYRRVALVALGGWDEAMTVEDTDMFYRLSRCGRCRLVPEPLVTYRVRLGSASGDRDFINRGWREFVTKHGAQFPRGGLTLLAEVLRTSAALSIDRGHYGDAARYLAEAVRLHPLNRHNPRTAAYLARRLMRGARADS